MVSPALEVGGVTARRSNPVYAVASLYGDSARWPGKGFHTLRVRSVKSTRTAAEKIKRRPGELLLESAQPLSVGQFLDTAYLPLDVQYLSNPRRVPRRALGAQRRTNPVRLSPEPITRRRQLEIARATLRLSDAMAGVMGGMSKPEARELLEQDRRARVATRRNPSLVTYLANPGRLVQIASDVQAVLYRHAKDGEFYLHVFGNKGDGDVKRFGRGEYLRLDTLPARTGVRLERLNGNTLVVRHRAGKPLAREF